MSGKRRYDMAQMVACEQDAKKAKKAVEGTYDALAQWEQRLQEQQEHLRSCYEGLEMEHAELERARANFESEQQRMVAEHVTPADVIGINMGGERVVQVKRSLLTQFEGSFLASQFSGRWEGMVSRDKDGNVFFDDPPEVLMPLIKWLREYRDAPPEHGPVAPCIEPAHRDQWEWMLDRLGLPDAKITTPGDDVAIFWYKTPSAVAFKWRNRPTDAWKDFNHPAVRDGNWWRTGNRFNTKNTPWMVSVLVNGVSRCVWKDP